MRYLRFIVMSSLAGLTSWQVDDERTIEAVAQLRGACFVRVEPEEAGIRDDEVVVEGVTRFDRRL